MVLMTFIKLIHALQRMIPNEFAETLTLSLALLLDGLVKNSLVSETLSDLHKIQNGHA